MKIEPFTSVGAVYLGSTINDVIDILGEPSSVEEEDFGDGKITKTLEYDSLNIEMSFDEDDNFLLSRITIRSSDATLWGKKIIGLNEKRLLTEVEQISGEIPILEDDFEVNGKDYTLDKWGLSFWVSDGKVTNVTVFPKFDPSGNNPIWPKKR